MRMDIINKLAKLGDAFTFEEAKKVIGSNTNTVKVILSRLEKRGILEKIEKGKYMIIPLGAKKGKYTLHEFVVASLLVNPYCIAYWSALNFYGLTEQIPFTVFLQTTTRKKQQEKEVLGIKYKIIRLKEEKLFGIRKEWIENTQINITDREKTIIDCLDKPQHCGGIVEVAKALKHGTLKKRKIVKYAKQIGNSGVTRRLGYLSEYVGKPIKLPKIEARNYLALDPTMPRKGLKNAKWKLLINLDEAILKNLE
jgi:predicted transcriptional regulator of viral defense system